MKKLLHCKNSCFLKRNISLISKTWRLQNITYLKVRLRPQKTSKDLKDLKRPKIPKKTKKNPQKTNMQSFTFGFWITTYVLGITKLVSST